MSGDKVKRLRAVRKWLEKAESCYSSHKEITGEINLIMAQAEMERLKETHPHRKARKRALQVAALAAAFGVFLGLNAIWHVIEPAGDQNTVPLQASAEKEVPIAQTPAAEPEKPAEEISTVEAAAPDTSYVEAAAYPSASSTMTAETVQTPAPPAQVVQPAPAPAPVRTAAPAPAKPALSDKEIQSVVGEAGRALRGQG